MIKTIANELRKIALKREPDLMAKVVFRVIEDRVKKIVPKEQTAPFMRTIIDGLAGEKLVVEPKMSPEGKKKIKTLEKNISELKTFIKRRTKDLGMDPKQVIQRLIPMKQKVK